MIGPPDGVIPARAGACGADDWSRALGAPRGAWFDASRSRRYLLWRTAVGNAARKKPLVFAMLNPSIAGADADDPTIRRCMGFADREGAGGIVVVNCASFIATDPEDMRRAYRQGALLSDEVNREAWSVARSFGPMILAWGGSLSSFLQRQADLLAAVAGNAPMCLGKTKSGEPRHPLTLRADTPLEPWAGALR